ncbi:MAG: hypothetical protein U9Q06_00990 [Nanoarchaeota archaeon]|nr:hypothetical protein [Nanoarchaeota archaeon]
MREFGKTTKKDVRFRIAVVMIALLIAVILYITVAGPSIQGYLIKNQIAGQQEAVKAITQIVNQQGYIVLNDGQNTMVLARNPELEAQLQESLSQEDQQLSDNLGQVEE